MVATASTHRISLNQTENSPLGPLVGVVWDGDENNEEDQDPPGLERADSQSLFDPLGGERRGEVHENEKDARGNGEQIGLEGAVAPGFQRRRFVASGDRLTSSAG